MVGGGGPPAAATAGPAFMPATPFGPPLPPLVSPPAAAAQAGPSSSGERPAASTSRTVTGMLSGEHEHAIEGYSLLKGLGDGEPVASDRFTVGGHEWVLLFYPDGKRSAAENASNPSTANDDPYAALFVALINEGSRPQGVVQSSAGRVVRAFHRFTLVDQRGDRHITKGRQREQGAVKISCARQDPAARNCHGYRKFVRRSVLESRDNGYLVNDTVIIRYKVDIVVTAGGALIKQVPPAAAPQLADVGATPSLGDELLPLLESGEGADCCFEVEGEAVQAHRLVLQARSPVFKAMLGATSAWREGEKGAVVRVGDIKATVFRIMLHFAYTDALPPEHAGPRLGVPLAQHLLAASDRFELTRLRALCEERLCEAVDVENAATTLALAEMNHAQPLKQACLSFVASNLSAVLQTEGFQHMSASCPSLHRELLAAVAEDRARPAARGAAAQAEAARRRGAVPRGLATKSDDLPGADDAAGAAREAFLIPLGASDDLDGAAGGRRVRARRS